MIILKVATIGVEYRVVPVNGIFDVLGIIQQYQMDILGILGVTFTYTTDVLSALNSICSNCRVIVGKYPKGRRDKLAGVTISGGSVHFKGLLCFSDTFTIYYIGSCNLAGGSGGDYGLVYVKKDGTISINLNHGISAYKDWMDPLETIFSDIVSRETNRKCELCGSVCDEFYLSNGLFVCEDCKR